MNQDLVLSDNLQQETSMVEAKAKEMTVVNNESNKVAVDYLRGIKTFIKKIDDECDPNINDVHSLHKNLVAQKKKFISPWRNAEQLIKMKVSKFLEDQEKIRAEAQRKAEAKARAEEDKRKAELERQALKAEAKGNDAKAEERRQEADSVHSPVPIVQSKAEQQEGFTMRDNWTAKVLNPDAVISAVIDGNLPPYCVKIDESALKRLSKLEKKAGIRYGVEFLNDKVSSMRV